jgi:hypothetical protein
VTRRRAPGGLRGCMSQTPVLPALDGGSLEDSHRGFSSLFAECSGGRCRHGNTHTIFHCMPCLRPSHFRPWRQSGDIGSAELSLQIEWRSIAIGPWLMCFGGSLITGRLWWSSWLWWLMGSGLVSTGQTASPSCKRLPFTRTVLEEINLGVPSIHPLT